MSNIFSDLGFTAQNGTPPSGALAARGSIDTGLTAVGASQGAGLQLVSQINVVSTSTTTTGIATVLPVGFKGATLDVVNSSANALSVYPPSGGTINGGSANAVDAGTVAAASSGVAGKSTYLCTSTNGLTWLRA